MQIVDVGWNYSSYLYRFPEKFSCPIDSKVLLNQSSTICVANVPDLSGINDLTHMVIRTKILAK